MMGRRPRRRSTQPPFSAQWALHPHSHSSVGRHSRESSTSRFSGSLKPGSRKINPNDAKSGGNNRHPVHKVQKPWKECDVIEEEGLVEDEESKKSVRRRCYFLAFVVGFFLLFSLFLLILWGASRPQKPKITMKMKNFYQSRKSQRTVIVSVIGYKIPLYGSGASLSTPAGTTNLSMPLKLNLVVRSRAYVLGKLVKPKFY